MKFRLYIIFLLKLIFILDFNNNLLAKITDNITHLVKFPAILTVFYHFKKIILHQLLKILTS